MVKTRTRDYGDPFEKGRIKKSNKSERINTVYYTVAFRNGVMIHQKYKDKFHCLHRDDGPAVRCYDKHGTLIEELWYTKGKLTRSELDGPACTKYYSNGNIECQEWFTNGVPNRIYGPAIRSFYEDGGVQSETFMYNGHRYKVNGMSTINYPQ